MSMPNENNTATVHYGFEDVTTVFKDLSHIHDTTYEPDDFDGDDQAAWLHSETLGLNGQIEFLLSNPSIEFVIDRESRSGDPEPKADYIEHLREHLKNITANPDEYF